MSKYLIFALAGFASGSILYSWLLPKLLVKKDVCELSEDGNPGAYNVFSHCGVILGTVCVLLDIAKGCLPVWAAARALNVSHLLFALVLVAPVAGHAFSPLRKFQGGKAISVGFGVMIAMLPTTLTGLILAGIYILFSTVVKIQPNRRRSLIAYSLFALIATPILLYRQMAAIAIGYLLIDAVIIYKHWTDHSEQSESFDEMQKLERLN